MRHKQKTQVDAKKKKDKSKIIQQIIKSQEATEITTPKLTEHDKEKGESETWEETKEAETSEDHRIIKNKKKREENIKERNEEHNEERKGINKDKKKK